MIKTKLKKLLTSSLIVIIIISFIINSMANYSSATTVSEAEKNMQSDAEVAYISGDSHLEEGWYLIFFNDNFGVNGDQQRYLVYPYVLDSTSNSYKLQSIDNGIKTGKLKDIDKARIGKLGYPLEIKKDIDNDKTKIYSDSQFSSLSTSAEIEKKESEPKYVTDAKPEWKMGGVVKYNDNDYQQYFDDEGQEYRVKITYGIVGNTTSENGVIVDNSENALRESLERQAKEKDTDPFSGFIDGLVGLLLYPIKVIPLLIGKGMSIVMNAFAGGNDSGDLGLDVDDILFNKVLLTDVNFFDLSDNVKQRDETVYQIRMCVATWYYSVRNIAIIALIVICIYVGIRMALATVAQDRAKYKEMLIDWLTGLALVFVLHYVMILIIYINNALVNIFKNGLDQNVGNVMDKFWGQAWQIGFTNGFISAICYLVLVGITFVFLLSYIKRMITIGFLIVIAPLVTITYSIDKMGDSKSQALNTWFKEFAYNILIQPFQCVSYLILAQTALKLLSESNDDKLGEMFRAGVLAIVMLVFILQTEKIIKHIFHFESNSMVDSVKNAALGVTAIATARGLLSNNNKSGGGEAGTAGGGNKRDIYKAQNEVKSASANSRNIDFEKAMSTSGSGGIGSARGATGNTGGRGRTGTQGRTAGSSTTASGKPEYKNKREAFKYGVSRTFGKAGSNKFVREYVNFARKAGAAMLTGGLVSGISGDLSQGAINATQAWDAEKKNKGKAVTATEKAINKHDLAKAYNNYANMYAEQHANENLTAQQINEATRQHALDLMNDDYVGKLSDEDKDFKEALEKVYADGKSNSVRGSYEKLNGVFNDIEEGKLGETTAQIKFTGKIKNHGNNNA